MFALGLFNIASGILLFIFQVFFDSSSEPVSYNFYYAMWFIFPFQLGTAVIIVCVP